MLFVKKMFVMLSLTLFWAFAFPRVWRSQKLSPIIKGLIGGFFAAITVLAFVATLPLTPDVQLPNVTIKIESGEPQVEPAPALESVPAEQKNFYGDGQFKVGVDIPAGEYLAVGTGYVEVAKDSLGGVNSILINDNIEDAQRYVAVRAGEYVKITNGLRLYSAAEAPKLDTSEKIPAGQFKAGVDIPAGEYRITLWANGYFAVTRDTRHTYVKNQFTLEGGSFYATVAEGQYLQIKNGEAQLAKTALLAEPVQKISNAGMTVDQFKKAFATVALSNGVANLSLDDAEYQSGTLQDAIKCSFSPNVNVVGAVDKSSGVIKSAEIFFTPQTQDDTLTAFTIYNIFMVIFNPELTPAERLELFAELHLTKDKIARLKDVSPKAIRGNWKYSAHFIDGYGVFSLSVAAKDF